MTRGIERIGCLYGAMILIGAIGVPTWIYGVMPVLKAWGWM